MWCLQIMRSRMYMPPSFLPVWGIRHWQVSRQAPPVPATNARSVLWCKSKRPYLRALPCLGKSKGKKKCLNGDGCDISTSLHASRGLQASTLHAPHSARGGGPISILEYLCTQLTDRAWGELVDPVIRCWNLSCAV